MRKIIVDVFGGDNGAAPVVTGVGRALLDDMSFNAVFVGDENIIRPVLDGMGVSNGRYDVIHTEKYITNNDPPTSVFGGNDDASMVMAYRYLRDDADSVAMLSPGNTGALLVGSICHLGLISGLKFPALSTAIPSMTGNLVCLVDCGANTDCTSADLVRFARMGSAFSKCMCGIDSPRVGLLSVGREEGKGNALTKEAFPKLKTLPINFIGNIEGSDVVTGYADVVVSDGFSGNILLKNTEAVGKAAIALLDGICDKPDGDMALLRKRLYEMFDLNSQGGATFLGTKKTVVKMHGCATDDTAYACIKQILRLDDGGFANALTEV